MASCRSHLALYFAMRASNKDRFPVGIDGGNAAITPATFAEIVSDDFPILQSLVTMRPLPGTVNDKSVHVDTLSRRTAIA
jgi:hypothetical protein